MRIIRFKKHLRKSSSSFLSAIGVIVCFYITSCSTPRNISYFRDVPDTIKSKVVNQATYSTPTIQADDILQVSIQTLDLSTTTVLNQQASTVWPMAGTPGQPSLTNTASSANVTGYLVDKEGYVVLPLLGKVFAKGKTTDQLRDEIGKKASEFYKEPTVVVRFANFKVTVLGEVNRPSTYVMPNEKVTLLDAIGVAGDLTVFGKRENVMLIRENNGKKEFVRFNLNDSRMFESQYYYLKQGDIVYVEPDKSKVASTDISQVKRISLMATALSLLIVIASRIKY